MWQTKLFWELTTINLVVIITVIVIAGFSVKEFACFLADEMNITGQFKQKSFDQTMDYYLIRASLIAFILAVTIHYFWIRRIILPVQTLSDVTNRISEGEAMQFVSVGANNEIGQLTENFNKLIRKLKRSEELRNQMTADLAHEVRTPLSNITGYLEAMKNGVIEPEQQLLASLHKESKRLNKLIDQLYNLAEQKWTMESFTPQNKQSIDIKNIVEGIIPLYKMEFEKHSIPYNISMEAAELNLEVGSINQILGNLLDNTIHYAVKDTRLFISGETYNQHYRVTLAAKGQSIPKKAQKQLFERLYRVDQSRNRNTGGNGLGLAIAKELVERQGGSIWLESDGSYHQFIIEFPLTENK